jgi:hypothetical protein
MKRALFGIVLMSLASAAHAHDMSAIDSAQSPNGMSGTIAMDPHMVMTPPRTRTDADIERAHQVLEALRHSLARYSDYRVALAHRMSIFMPSVPQDVYHFTDFSAAGNEYRGRHDLDHPGSLLYKRDGDGFRLVGAMYSASPGASMDELDTVVPLSVASWHEHVNICLPADLTLNDLLRGDIGANETNEAGFLPIANNPSAISINQRLGFMADGRFGFTGKISSAPACESAGGHFIPLAFGWMVHAYPFAGDDLAVAFAHDPPK